MSRRILTRLGCVIVTLVAAATLVFTSATGAHAQHEERALHITRVDGSPVGTLFSDWVMVPGDKVKTTVLAHRTGEGESSLLITLGDSDDMLDRPTTRVEDDVIIRAGANGRELQSSAAALMTGDVMLDLGRSSDRVVPVDITFELPYSSGNATQQQSMNLAVTVVAADIPDGLATVLPFLPDTGASLREMLIVAAVFTTFGLLLLGGRRKTQHSANPG